MSFSATFKGLFEPIGDLFRDMMSSWDGGYWDENELDSLDEDSSEDDDPCPMHEPMRATDVEASLRLVRRRPLRGARKPRTFRD